MKNLKFKKSLNLRSLTFAGIVAIALFTISCDKESDGYIPSVSEADLKSAENSKAVKKGDASIAEIAIGAGFSELVAALAYVDEAMDAGLVNLFLNGTDQYTVFAPTNDAFDALYETLGVDGITDIPASTVLNVLLYHVTDGRRAANSVVPQNGVRTIYTLSTESFKVDTSGKIWANGGNSAMITSANVSASNGIIHIIDAVILPTL